MTVGEFADLVERMRTAQKDYFRLHSLSDLHKSKELEKLVDKAIAERHQKHVDALQAKLF